MQSRVAALAKSALRIVLIGGDASAARLSWSWKSRNGPQLQFFSAYGPTETVAGCTIDARLKVRSFDVIARPSAGHTQIGWPTYSTLSFSLFLLVYVASFTFRVPVLHAAI